jgi:peptidoglycan/xylan/chitin deacetylase (PgdA/CDA1 family)
MIKPPRAVAPLAFFIGCALGCSRPTRIPHSASAPREAVLSAASAGTARSRTDVSPVSETDAHPFWPSLAKTTPQKSANAAGPTLLPGTASIGRGAPLHELAAPSEPESQGCRIPPKKGDEPAGLYPSSARRSGEVALTFDDGPHPTGTPKVLDLLANYRMKATFFLVGRAIRRDTYQLVQRMVAEGHSLGSHSYNHDVEMAVRNHGEQSIEYIHGNHATTEILIQIALLARSADDFDALFARVIGDRPDQYLTSKSLRTEFRARAARLSEVLVERGFGAGARPYPIVFSRPPAGTPYVGLSSPAQKHLYTEAMERLGWLNVMWHGESGDVHPSRKDDFDYLRGNLNRHARLGGVLLIHDYIRKDALAAALSAVAADPTVKVVPLEKVVQETYGCSTEDLQKEGVLAAKPERPADSVTRVARHDDRAQRLDKPE